MGMVWNQSYKFTIFYGSSLQFESQEFEVEATGQTAAQKKAKEHAEKWLTTTDNDGYSLQEYRYSINFK